MINRDCQPGKYSLDKIRDMSKNTDVLYLFEKATPICVLLLDIFTNHKMIYIHDVCVAKLHRGKGLFKKSLDFLKKHYSKKGYTQFTLDASDSTKEKGLDQKARIHIFHSAGFDINTETGYFTNSGEYKVIKTMVLLDNNEIVEIQKKEGDNYYVKNDMGKKYSVDIGQIEKCLDAELNQISCPMIMHASSRKVKRAKRKMQRKTQKKMK